MDSKYVRNFYLISRVNVGFKYFWYFILEIELQLKALRVWLCFRPKTD